MPTIVEAAQALYSKHNVEEITRHDGNIDVTTKKIDEIIDYSKANNRKSICFVTGVPGAGKTLVGLNIAITHSDSKSDERAAYLSGNGPLVEVLKEALVRDRFQQQKVAKKDKKDKTKRLSKRDIERSIHFVEIIHKFRDEYIIHEEKCPPEHVVIFDEAQRAWTLEKMSSFMKRKKGIADYNHSEPESLIGAMDRHESWATILCLVGGGQEIFDGEAGIAEWFDSLRRSFSDWDVYVAPELNDIEYCRNTTWDDMIRDLNPIFDKDLHLRNSIRSFRTPYLSSFVKNLLEVDVEAAKRDLQEIGGKYPIYVTRDLNKAKMWIHEVSRGNCRHGIIASSKGRRLKPEGIFVDNRIKIVEWFLGGKKNVLSSHFMEDVATEFEIQGLEIDYAIVAWDADLRFNEKKNRWEYYNFRGSRWVQINKEIDQRYLLNAYRVLLTRARQGMVIFVPEGLDDDGTRLEKWYDETYKYLYRLGINIIEI